jgi:protein TonB
MPKWIIVSGYGFLSLMIISVASYFYFQSDDSSVQETSPTQPKSTVDSISTLKENQIEKTVQESKKEIKTSVVPVSPSSSKASEKKILKDSATSIEKTPISQFTEATPVDGYPALYSYFDKELKYPGSPKDSIQGIETVSFAINVNGKPDHIKIENSLGKAFDDESKRVIENMPLWKSATINGKPVSVRLSIPLTFKIKK